MKNFGHSVTHFRRSSAAWNKGLLPSFEVWYFNGVVHLSSSNLQSPSSISFVVIVLSSITDPTERFSQNTNSLLFL